MKDDEHEREPEARQDEREREREARHAERDARRAERDARREERHRVRAEFRQQFGDELRRKIGDEVRSGLRGWTFGYRDLGDAHQFRMSSPGSAEVNDVVEQRFQVQGMPTVRASNVSGETEITVGNANEVFVRARKRVHGWSEERARRLLENVEIKMEQSGDEIVIEPRLFEQERGWPELFRGGRVAVDLDIRVPREARVEARTVSGQLSLSGTRGPADLQSVSGEVDISDVQGPLRLRTVSGDVNATGYAGQIEVNSVSGEVEFERSRVRTPDIVTVSGDIELDAVHIAGGGGEGRVKTVSGDLELALGEWDGEIDFKTMSGDVELAGPGRIEKEGRRDRRVILGSGEARLRVKSVSGDLRVRHATNGAPEPEAAPDEQPEPAAASSGPSPAAKEILERLARGELSVDDAAAALDATRNA